LIVKGEEQRPSGRSLQEGGAVMIGIVVIADTGVIAAKTGVEIIVRPVGQQDALRLNLEHPG